MHEGETQNLSWSHFTPKPEEKNQKLLFVTKQNFLHSNVALQLVQQIIHPHFHCYMRIVKL